VVGGGGGGHGFSGGTEFKKKQEETWGSEPKKDGGGKKKLDLGEERCRKGRWGGEEKWTLIVAVVPKNKKKDRPLKPA